MQNLTNMHFMVDVPKLLEEIQLGAMRTKDSAALRIPMRAFLGYLKKIAKRASEIDDPELNILMIETKLYEVKHEQIQDLLKGQKERLKKSRQTINKSHLKSIQ